MARVRSNPSQPQRKLDLRILLRESLSRPDFQVRWFGHPGHLVDVTRAKVSRSILMGSSNSLRQREFLVGPFVLRRKAGKKVEKMDLMCLSRYLSVSLSVSLSVGLFVCVSVCQFLCLCLCLSVYLSTCTCQFIYRRYGIRRWGGTEICSTQP